MNHLYHLYNSQISNIGLTTTYSEIWSGDSILAYALFNCSSDNIIISIFNGGEERIVFDLETLKDNFRLDSNLYNPVIRMYSTNRWTVDFRAFGGVYPEGANGIQVMMKSTSGSRTLENAMIFWSKR